MHYMKVILKQFAGAVHMQMSDLPRACKVIARENQVGKKWELNPDYRAQRKTRYH